MKKIRKASSFVVCLIMILSLTLGASASTTAIQEIPDGGFISPRYIYISDASAYLSISAGKAQASGTLVGIRGTTTKIVVSMYLQKKTSSGGWITEKYWSETFNSHSAYISKSQSVAKGTYRVKAVFTAYKGSSSELTTKYSTEKVY